MKVLLTGASSFTGYWFAEALAGAGAQVVAPMRGRLGDYGEGARGERVRRLAGVARIVEDAAFGSERFLALARGENFDLLCHHAARVGDYRSPDFDIAGALAENTLNLRPGLKALLDGGLKGVVLTGSVFEQNEGVGDAPLVAFSPYGLSKGFTAEVVAQRCRELEVTYGKFVIPNPFGVLEEPRFGAYLVRTWKKGEPARVNTPDYIRDNIHVSLLASAYARFSGEVAAAKTGSLMQLHPSGYVETQGAFAFRFAEAMRPRLRIACAVELGVQTDFSEPMMRVNTVAARRYASDWDEAAAWDAISTYYTNGPYS